MQMIVQYRLPPMTCRVQPGTFDKVYRPFDKAAPLPTMRSAGYGESQVKAACAALSDLRAVPYRCVVLHSTHWVGSV